MENQASASFAHNGLQFLSQVMNLYPGQWNASSRRILLMDVAVLGKESNAADLAFRIHRLKENLLLPLATIILNEKEAIKSEKEAIKSEKEKSDVNEQQLQEDKRKLVQQLREASDQVAQQSIFIETLLEDMGSASEQHKRVVEQLQNIILVKDLEIQRLLAEKEELLASLVSQWPNSNSDRESIVDSLKNSIKENCLEWISSASENYAFLDRSPSVSSNASSTVTNLSTTLQQDFLFDPPKKLSSGLLQVLVTGVWHEGMYSFRMVEQRGLLSAPLAVIHFWVSLAGRVTDHVTGMILSKMKQGLAALI